MLCGSGGACLHCRYRRSSNLRPNGSRNSFVMCRARLTVLLCAAAVFTGCGNVVVPLDSPAATTTVPDVPTQLATPSPIQHVVIIMQENRSFDNLFNGFPGADTVTFGLDKKTVVPLQPVSLADGRDVDHSHTSWWLDW